MLERLKRAFAAPRAAGREIATAPGLTHFAREHDGRQVRYHLRVEPDGSGLLLANASAAVRLAPTGVLIAEGLLNGDTEEAIRRHLHERFRGGERRAADDVRTLRGVLDDLAEPRGRYPVQSLAPDDTVFARALGAPLSADLTAGGDVDDALALLGKLWDATIPQVVLSLPDGADPAALPRLVERAEDLGLIAGVRGRALDLAADGLLAELAQAGVDHLDVFFGGAAHHDALFGEGDFAAAEALIGRALELEVCPVAVIPVVPTTFEALDDIAETTARLHVPAALLYAIVSETDETALAPAEARQAAATAEELADHFGQNVVWAPPIERDPAVELAHEVRRGPRTSGEDGVRVTADGAVLPPVGPGEPVGDLLSEPWRALWAHRAFVHLREVVAAPERCGACPGLALCASGCPAAPASWARATGGAR